MSKLVLIIGAGITGITLAETFSSLGNKILLIEKRNHIGGNCYDFLDNNEILVHKYGPHIFHTDYKEVWDYLSRFTEWIYYKHKVLSFIDGKFAPVPFNLNTLNKLLPEVLAKKLEKKLISKFGYNKKIPILEMKKLKDKDLKLLADFIYEKIYLNYSKKQWGVKPEEIDSSITERVPVVITWDDRYFWDKYQGIPKYGYTLMFEKMLKNKNIKINLNTDFKELNNKSKYDLLLYTGPIDEFFNYKYGKLYYRCARLELKTLNQRNYQPAAVVNYPNDCDFTRVTEYKKITKQSSEKTTIGIEYPGNKGFLAWPFLDKNNIEVYKSYYKEAEKMKSKNIYFLGRLARYKYFDMDDSVKNALDMFREIVYGRKK